MPDHRTKRQKLEAVANAPSASEGERRNARALLAKMKPETKPPGPVRDPGYSFADARRDSGYGAVYDDFIDRAVRDARASFSGEWETVFEAAYEDRVNQSQMCRSRGHVWVVIGETILHADISRCTRCGEYNPPRRK